MNWLRFRSWKESVVGRLLGRLLQKGTRTETSATILKMWPHPDVEGGPSLEGLFALADVVRGIAAGEEELGAPLRNTIIVPLQIGVLNLLAHLSEVTGLKSKVVAAHLIELFYDNLPGLDATTVRTATISQIGFALRFERAALPADEWTSLSVDLAEGVRQSLVKDGERLHIQHGTLACAAILVVEIWNDPTTWNDPSKDPPASKMV